MKTISPALSDLLASGEPFGKADIYTWTFVDGTILRTTSADVDLSWSDDIYPSCQPAIERAKVRLKVGIEADSMDITIKPDLGQTVGGLAWPVAARLGYLDGARVLIETAYVAAWPTVVGVLHVFEGIIGDAYPERNEVRAKVMSDLELLAQPFPRNVYQTVCGRTLYDSGCGVSKAAFTSTSAVVSSPTPTLTSFKTGHSQAAGYFDQGVITFTSGANAGLKRTVKSYDPSTGFTFALPLPIAPSAGDTVSVTAGCDRTRGTCEAKFANLDRFRGFPFVPNPETAAPAIPGYTKTGK